ncbi:hypothetical protein PTTG_27145 [Puccinia triticina 1-1 BBBD Race 1]|uniref:Ecp2 effector protein domain-containing protein n=2 Tax=Puccinia triticina TaxID=208348 RepID=A0A180GNC8_PUCT1|nr:uncharacterized protein PtA15_2A761 [Puccinia triticina]OAV93919.1 hypothetical protein PTTG_27145 [Puccinia triticina 1-1 BBBD Race 1]WAQ82444.1 hypothetical protein PtA15_2A761 [Puccinia triticina]WAR53298.1 hypothetical protein PtB15_2B729 [Puccinia triticina]
MSFFNLRTSALVATVLMILLSSPSQVASAALERRDDRCNPQNQYLVPHDCALAFLNLNFQGDSQMVRGPSAVNAASGTCRVIVDCPGGTKVSAGRLLDRNGPNGFDALQQICTKYGQAGQMFVNGGCQIRTELSTS